MTMALTARVSDRLEQGELRVPMLPQVAWKLVTMEDDADVRAFETLVYADHALAAHVMRIANSVALAGRVPVVSLRQALVRLGMRLVREVALVAAIGDNVVRLPGFEAELRALWRHALHTALWTQVVARLRGDDAERAFVAGLLVDVGRAVAFRLAVEATRAQGGAVSAGIALEAAEALTTEVGVRIATAWELPEELREVIAHAARPHAAGRHRALVLTVGVGRWLAAADEADYPRLAEHAALPALGLGPSHAHAIVRQHRRVADMLESFSL